MPSLKRVTVYFLLAVLAFFTYLGAFTRITVTEAVSPDRKLLGQWNVGSFSQIGDVQKTLYNLIVPLNLPVGSWAGVYIDNPKEVDSDKLRWFYGVELLVDNPSEQSWSGLSLIPLHLPQTKILRTTFPLHPRLVPFSMILGVQRVYRAITNYCVEHGVTHGPVTEVYDMKRQQIIYEAYKDMPATLQEHLGRKILRKKQKDEL